MAFLELHDIHKSYYLGKEEFPVLNGINLNFELGEFVSILGESGGGKSTLMNIIGGLDRNFEGQVIFNDQKLDHKKEKQLDNYRRGTIGYIYQSYNLISHLNIVDNVLVSLNMTTLSGSERKKRAIDLLKQVGLGEHLKKHPNQLSGGQKQRVAIARALASDPQIIIADEPTGALDSKNTAEVLEILSGIAAQGKLVIAVTHSEEVADHGTRIVHLVDGKIDGDTRIKEAYPVVDEKPAFKPKVLSAAASYRNAFQHLSFNFWRNSLIMLGTAIGLFAVLLFSGLGNGVSAYIQNQITSMVNPQSVTVLKNPSGKKSSMTKLQQSISQYASNPEKLLIKDSQVKKLKNIKNVDEVEPGYQFSTFTLAYNKKTQNGSGFQTWTKAYASDTVKTGHKPGKNEIVIDKSQAIALTSDKTYKKLLGKTIKLSLPWIDAHNNPVQVTAKLKVVGFANGGQSGSITGTNYATMKNILEKAKATTEANFVSVNASNSDVVKKVAKQVNNIKENGKYVLGAITVGDILDTVNQYVSVASIILASIAGISLIVSALMIIVTMYMSVSERTKEIGILRALGERRKDIRRLFTAESVFIGLFSAALSLILAYGASILLNQVLYKIVKFNMVQITWGNVLFTVIIAIVISFIVALLPARRASRLNPIDALSAD
ncbi:ATP-binding cassette domain-containing protein [Pediococcus ethanolidurans]|uniref:ABC transporter ATP-binding protein/permease n=1 Tax=Pediococcus ethanolidurans TaxID=319653 RepID=UPI001C1EC72C|nr:ABC transporter ATP-binding protein/permease [Pediococcus ethanolidurans]MBU7554335.1 ATP-binding cassette domain-containing protein [Pediococcus ethanolidurans]MCT4397975.1 ABC transporter ATP-binding protein/permease [Pediococcus ethanolidurans]MCV3316119.1 ATP-binding cassette domain-containing protein [Pediococcus ethanolidurans]MCV3321105.1 ATP-binding cassette domain-containing protein [Pediococcus ethanolidurans]MCV3323808.1 ATP-binding cassette domain-containing protein [Pediococcus